MKRILSLMIVLTMVLSLISLPAFAEDPGYTIETEGKIVTITSQTGWNTIMADDTYYNANY